MTAANTQVGEQRGRQRRPGFVKGKSGNPRGSRLAIERRAAMLADLERECGRPITGTDRVMAERGIELLTRRPRSHDEAVRLVNAGSRIIGQLRAKYAKPVPKSARLPSPHGEAEDTIIEKLAARDAGREDDAA
jgi:hypothetical protein